MLFQGTEVSLIEGCGVNGAALQEYQVSLSLSADGVPMVSCYVESRDGMTFSVRWQGPPTGLPSDQRGKTILDGLRMRTVSRSRGEKIPGADMGHRLDREGTKRRPYTFSAIRLTDDEEATETSEKIIKGLGTVRFELSEVRYDTRIRKEIFRPSGVTGTESMMFDEKNKKAQLSQSAGVGEAVDAATRKKWHPPRRLLWEAPRPFVIFEFKYRSRQLLETEGIIRPAEPARVVSATLSAPPPAPLQRLASPPAPVAGPSSSNAVKDLEPPRNKNVKRENNLVDLTDEKPAKRFKKEPAAGASKVVIDLT